MLRSLLFALVLSAPVVAQARHVVVVLLDDVGLDKVGCYGVHPTAGPTPILDGFAASGLRFTQAYANPRGSPTRCAMLTGRYGSRTGIGTTVPVYSPQTSEAGPFVPSNDLPWLPRMLHVRSFLVGGWHLTTEEQPGFHQDPIAKGFASWRGHLSNPLPAQGEGQYHWKKQDANGSGWSEDWSSDFISVDNSIEAKDALVLTAGHRSLVWLAFNAAHVPWQDPPVEFGLHEPVEGEQTAALKEQYQVEAADTLLGDLWYYWGDLYVQDWAKTTWIVMGDNGTASAAVEAPWDKDHANGTVYQGGVHVPLIAWGYGVPHGVVTDALVDPTDIWATVFDLFGVPKPPHVKTDSISFAPVLAGGAGQRSAAYVRQHVPNGFGPYSELNEAATDGRWKLIQRLGGVHELYNLDADPLELSDLWPPDPGAEQAAAAALQPVIDAANAP